MIADCEPAMIAAENLTKAAASPMAEIDAWMHSPGYRSDLFDLLDPTLTEIGVGCSKTLGRCSVYRCSSATKRRG